MVQLRRKEPSKCNEHIGMLMQKGANYSVVSTTLLIDLTSNFTQSPQSSTKPILCYLTNVLITITRLSLSSTEILCEEACKIDLTHDAQHLCTCLRNDGIKVMSNGFSGGKQVIKYNHRQVCLFVTTENFLR